VVELGRCLILEVRMRPQRCFASSILALSLAVTVSGQAPKLTFDVASVKVQREPLGPASLGTAIPRVRARGVFSGTHATVESLVRFAYALQTFQVIGGPDWIRHDRLDIDARAGFDAPDPQIRLMVQSLLEDRFKLVTHTEQRDMRYLALVLARTDGQPGPYLRRLDDGACYGRSVGEVGREELPDRALPSVRNRIAGACAELRDLAESLSWLLGTLVIDRTGLDGRWVYDAPSGTRPPAVLPRLGAPLPADAGSAEPGLPSLTLALEEYFGLKLESARGPVDVLVIDSVQQPTEN
jgi:uncharacterized protein (TIGR03435 family)